MKHLPGLRDTVAIKSTIYYEAENRLYAWHNGDLEEADQATTAVVAAGQMPYVTLIMTRDRQVLSLQDPA